MAATARIAGKNIKTWDITFGESAGTAATETIANAVDSDWTATETDMGGVYTDGITAYGRMPIVMALSGTSLVVKGDGAGTARVRLERPNTIAR